MAGLLELELEIDDLSITLPSHTLDLSRKGITQLPYEIPGSYILENLYLEGNQLTALPDSLFSCCPKLKWLDLRNNQLEVLPPSIEKLRSLRTLLLEGNLLVSLPVQLCRLPLLTGLNISRNPLEVPPKQIVDKGTRAVLSYLRDSMTDEEIHSSDSSSSLADSGEGSSTYIPIKSIAADSMQKASSCTLPLPAMKPVTLHAQEVSHSRKASTLSAQRKIKWTSNSGKAAQGHHSKAKSIPKRDRVEINKSLDKLKSKQGLEEWRNQAKLKQKLKEKMFQDQEQHSYVKAVEIAPFATETMKTPAESSQPSRTLQDDHLEGKVRWKVEVDQEMVEKYRTKLEEKRKQVGIITTPSSELKEAEKTLAEAMAMQEELENRKSREYRLTAFTGDLPF